MVNKSFVGYLSVGNHEASGLKDFILDFIEKHYRRFKKQCTGQRYEGARA